MAAPAVQTTEHPVGGGQSPYFLSGPGGTIGAFQDPYGAVFTGTISGTTLTVLSLIQGSIVPGQTITTGAASPCTIVAAGTATAQYGAGAVGTWTISVSQTVSTVTTFTSGAGGATQPFGNAQTAIARGVQAGVIATYHSAQTPAAVAQGTTAEQTLTIQTGTGATMLLAAGDLVFVNKPTSQAGLGVGNVRVSSGNTLGITYVNVPPAGGNITPTASQNYGVIALRGVGLHSLTAVLSPAAVAANTTAEQQFPVVGLAVGQLVQVNKPTQQAGLDIGGMRVVSNNVLGITFINTTAAAITPTAAETYNIAVLPGLDAANNDVWYGMNVGTVGAIGPGTVVTGGNTAVQGVLATDMVTGVMKPTLQAAATNAAIPYSAIAGANALTLSFFGVGTGYTPTASEVYGIRTARIAPAAPLVVFSQTLTPTSVAAQTTAEQTFAITSPNTLIASSAVWINKVSSVTPGLAILGVRVSAANTLAITFANMTATAITPPAESYLIGNFQTVLPGAGNCVYQSVVPALSNAASLTNAIRAALASMNFIAGA